jgi:hypothetical protein
MEWHFHDIKSVFALHGFLFLFYIYFILFHQAPFNHYLLHTRNWYLRHIFEQLKVFFFFSLFCLNALIISVSP